jgi:hypothetical protein
MLVAVESTDPVTFETVKSVMGTPVVGVPFELLKSNWISTGEGTYQLGYHSHNLAQ